MTSSQFSLFDDFFSDCEIDQVIDEVAESKVQELDYEIRRSKRRKKSVGAFREQGRTIIVAPIRMSTKEVHEYAQELIQKLNYQQEKVSSQELLESRARHLVKIYLDVDVFSEHPVPVTIRWVTNQNSRWGSCTPGDGNIRISHRLQGMPEYVIDAVVLHELVHLIVADHSPRFYEYLAKYEDYRLAKEYLAGYSFAQQNLAGS